jgi:CubicO group peptidase (beta-lactamase class C family)
MSSSIVPWRLRAGLVPLVAVAMLISGCAAQTPPPAVPSVSTQPPGTAATPSADPAVAAVIARYQQQIPELMAQQNVPGLSVAVVDGDHVLWEQGFGYTDSDHRTPITTDTIFSVQSMSKLFTATAVMQAVQAGLVDLDVPITTYLPDFTVHSAFEEHPERKISLRMLLSHTAGFTHEAPVGNNDSVDPGDFDAHVLSIEDTWLRFPVGTGYAYSNLGIDLAGYILEKVEGRPFAQIMDDSLLAPLGMDHSTFDRARIRATADRAVGHSSGMAARQVDVPMTGAGGLYASAADLARFLSFQISGGAIDGRTVLDPALMDEMRTVPAPNAGAPMGYALGVVRTRWRAEGYQDLFNHGGGGFGFLSDLWWAPKIGIGIAVLTNSSDHDLQTNLAISIMRAFVDEPGSAFGKRLLTLPPQTEFTDLDTHYQAPAGMALTIAALAMPPSSDQTARWATYAGTYRIASWGVISPTEKPERFLIVPAGAYFESVDNGIVTSHRLTEFQPGLFLSDDGETLDFTGQQPTWRNLDLIRVNDGPLPWQWAILALVALVAVAWFVGGMVGVVRRRRSNSTTAEPGGRRWRRLMSVVASISAVFALATIALIVVVPALTDSGFLGWLDLPLAVRLVFHLPLAVAFLAGSLIALAALAWLRHGWRPAAGPRYAALAVALVVLAGQLALWNLIGWGLS